MQTIYQEAETVLYKSTGIFFARPRQDLGVFLISVSEQACTSITGLELPYPLGDWYTIDLLQVVKAYDVAFVGVQVSHRTWGCCESALQTMHIKAGSLPPHSSVEELWNN